MFRMVSPPIIRNSCHCIYSIWHYLDRYWHLSCPIQSRSRQVAVTASIMPDTVDTVIWAPDDGWRYHPKHVEQLFTPWCRVLLEKLTGLQVVKKFPAFHGTRRFITALTSVRHLSLSWASPIQSIYPHPTSCRSILILSTYLRLGLPSGLLPSGFPSKTLYTPLSSPIRATCPAHLILLDFITRTILGEEYKSFSSSLCNLLHSPVTSSLLGPNILLNTMFSNTLSLLSSRNVSDQVSHPHKTTGKIIVLYILIATPYYISE